MIDNNEKSGNGKESKIHLTVVVDQEGRVKSAKTKNTPGFIEPQVGLGVRR